LSSSLLNPSTYFIKTKNQIPPANAKPEKTENVATTPIKLIMKGVMKHTTRQENQEKKEPTVF